MPTNDSDVSQQAGVGSGSAAMIRIQKPGLGTIVGEGTLASMTFRAAGLSQAFQTSREEDGHLTCLPIDHLWESYSPSDDIVTEVRQHLIDKRWLSEKGKWNGIDGEKIDKKHFAAWSKGANEVKAFAFFSRLFNAVLEYLRQSGRGTSIEKMVQVAGAESTGFGGHRPNAILHVVVKPPLASSRFKWRDLTCPFEYKLRKGDAVDNSSKTLWNLHHIVRSDPRRMFSFGSTVQGTMFSIWLFCRAAPFTFTPFDWFEDPHSLIKFFVLLATSSERDLGFDTNIERVGESDFDLQFTVEGETYRTSKLLYDIGTGKLTGRGTWVFEVKDQAAKVYVIKDCWVEDRPGKQKEHEILTGIKSDTSDEKFRESFVDIRGHRETYTSGGFGKILNNRKLKPKPIGVQDHLFQSINEKEVPRSPPYPWFRYQVVYDEKGKSLFEVTSLSKVLVHICQAAEALHCLHEAGWVHKDFSPGNIIVVGTNAKISDLEFAKRRAVDQLEQLTRPVGPSSPAVREVRTGTSLFAAVEVQRGKYLFTPRVSARSKQTRTFLHNPLHDYESVWWTAAWFVFNSKPEGVSEDAMKAARNELYQNRITTFMATDVMAGAFELLPEVLQPLGNVLTEMNDTLVGAYQDFEKDFDGAKTLLVFPKLRELLQSLAEQARDLDIKPVVMQLKLNVEEVKEFDAVGEQEWRDYREEEEGEEGEDEDEDEGVEGQPTDINPSPATPGKRKRRRDDSPPKVNPALRLDRFLGERMVGS